MSLIADIIERLSSIQVVKERLRDTLARVARWAGRIAAARQMRDFDRCVVRIETFAENAGARRRLPKRD